MIDQKLQDYLLEFIKDPDNYTTNFNLGVYYDTIDQTASAVSYYLRCAERTDSDLFKYQCILRSALCFSVQGCRNTTVKGLFQHAIAIMPTRPEGYYLLKSEGQAVLRKDN